MRILPIIFIIFSFLAISCKTEKDMEYEEFETYTKSFGITPSDSSVYVFIPGNQCKNCIQLDGSKFTNEVNKKVFVFSGFPKEKILNFEHFYFDREDKMMGLKFLDYGNKIISCEKGKLKTNEVMTDLYGQVEQVLKK